MSKKLDIPIIILQKIFLPFYTKSQTTVEFEHLLDFIHLKPTKFSAGVADLEEIITKLRFILISIGLGDCSCINKIAGTFCEAN